MVGIQLSTKCHSYLVLTWIPIWNNLNLLRESRHVLCQECLVDMTVFLIFSHLVRPRFQKPDVRCNRFFQEMNTCGKSWGSTFPSVSDLGSVSGRSENLYIFGSILLSVQKELQVNVTPGHELQVNVTPGQEPSPFFHVSPSPCFLITDKQRSKGNT